MNNVLVVVESFHGEFKKTALEAVTYGKTLAQLLGGQCKALVLGPSTGGAQLGIYGADHVSIVPSIQSMADNQAISGLIVTQAQTFGCGAIILSNNSTGRGLTARLAAGLESGCATGVLDMVELDGDKLIVSRSVYAGKAKARVSLSGECKVLSLSSNAIGLRSDGNEVAVETIDFISPDSKVKVLDTKRVSGRTPLPEAETVVSAGRGMKEAANWGIIEALADALGATTACSRPVADAGWRPHHEHVGQTGLAIKPNLYIAIGISGAIQHLAGVNSSKVIVVINKDPEAPFFQAATYGICADLFDVVPRLTAAITKLKAG